MAHIVIVSAGYTSYVNACYQIASDLRREDHTVTFVSPVDVAEAVEAQGFSFRLLAQESVLRSNPEREQLDRMSARQRYRNRQMLVAVSQSEQSHWLATESKTEFEEMLDDLAPDLLLIEEEMCEHIVVASATGIPMLLLQYWVGTRDGPGVPPMGTPLLPGSSLQERAKVQRVRLIAWMKRRLTDRFARHYYGGTDRRSTVYKLADRYGIDRALIDHSQWWPLVFTHAPTLFLNTWELDFPNAVAEGAKRWHVGPQIYLERKQAGADPAFEEALAEFITRRNARTAKPAKLVYCAMGSIHGNSDYFKSVIGAFVQRPHYTLFLSLGPRVQREMLGKLPENVRAFSFVPQLAVLQHADLMLCHGGIGTINECLFFGVPMLVYSAGYADQDSNAARVAYHDLGIRGNLPNATSEKIAGQIDFILGNSAINASVRSMQKVCARYRQENRAITRINETLRTLAH